MSLLVNESIKYAESINVTKVSPRLLKEMIDQVECFDFLRDLAHDFKDTSTSDANSSKKKKRTQSSVPVQNESSSNPHDKQDVQQDPSTSNPIPMESSKKVKVEIEPVDPESIEYFI